MHKSSSSTRLIIQPFAEDGRAGLHRNIRHPGKRFPFQSSTQFIYPLQQAWGPFQCDGVRPACSRCIGRQLTCVYTDEDDGRGTAQKSYVRLLQARVGILEKILWLHSIDADAAAAQLVQQNAIPTSVMPFTSGPIATLDQLCDAFEGTLSLDEAQNFDQDGEARYFGPSSGRLEFKTCNDMLGDSPSDSYSPPTDVSHIMRDENTVSEELEAHLLELYFVWEQPWLQIVDEALFRESRANNGRYFNPLLLNCILACGSRFSDRVEVRLDPNDPNTAGRPFLDEAEVLLQADLKRPSLTTIQSLAILGTVYHALGQDSAGWLHSGMANRLVLDMGLHLDPNSLVASGRMTVAEAELRRQIYWSLYCVDKLAAGYTGRVCCILDFQGAVGLPTIPTHAQKEDIRHALYSVSPNLLVSLHTSLIKLCQILERILVNLYAPKKMPFGDHRTAFFDSCLLGLKSWSYGLRTELKPVQNGAPNPLPQVYTLGMTYHTAILLLARPYIDCREPTSSTNTLPDALVSKASGIFLDAARSISSLGDQYRKAFGSFRRSPITATHATLSAALALLNPRHQHHHKPRLDVGDNADIMSCIQTLEELSTAWMPPGKYYRSIVKMMQDRSECQQKDTTASDQPFLSDGHISALGPTSRNAGDSIQQGNTLLSNDIWPDISVDDMFWPSRASTVGGDPGIGQLLPCQAGASMPWETANWDWFCSSFPGAEDSLGK